MNKGLSVVVINGLDTNNQSDRDALRSQGFFIDSSGVYSPGGNGSQNGQRVGDTFSGANSSQNTAPSGPYLPLKNGTPQSPLQAQTYSGGQNGAVPVNSPDFSSLFGPGSYFFSTGGPMQYQWMQPAAGASSSQSFMSALVNYLNGATNAGSPTQSIASTNGGSGSGNTMSTNTTPRPQVSSTPSAPPANPAAPYTFNAGPTMNNNDYLMMLRQQYPSLYGAGSLRQIGS